MVMDAVVERCVELSPVTVMATLALQRALEPAWIDELFERAGGTQYTRELLFSTTVELMSVVAVGLRPSVHAAAKANLHRFLCTPLHRLGRSGWKPHGRPKPVIGQKLAKTFGGDEGSR